MVSAFIGSKNSVIVAIFDIAVATIYDAKSESSSAPDTWSVAESGRQDRNLARSNLTRFRRVLTHVPRDT